MLDGAGGAIAVLLLWWRRQHPTAVSIGVIALTAVCLSAGGALLVVVLNAAIRVPWRSLGVITVTSLAASVIVALVHGQEFQFGEFVFGVLLIAIVVGWGLFVRAQRDLVTTLHAHADRVEQDRDAAETRARDAERRRIAREMHDVLAHRISMLGLHAGALEYRGESATSTEVAHAAGIIRSSAAEAMQELREVIGLLRDVDTAAGLEPPQPTIARIPQLVEESRLAGVRVDATIAPPRGVEVPAGTQLAAYRLVQEGLTNARRHAPGSRVEVRVEPVAADLLVEVVTRTSVRAPAPSGASARTSGAGLIGLGERVALLRGQFDHGIDDHGDFRLTAILPLPA